VSRLSIGRTLSHFRIEQRLGQGAMGEVYRATDLKLGRPVALKILSAETLLQPEARRRFHEEARLASALNHPHIVTIHAIEEAEGHELIVMEFVEGETLLQMTRREPLDTATLIELGIQVAEALAAAHAIGLIHRDIKPANILVNREGQAKVADFGLAKRLEVEGAEADPGETRLQLTQSGVVVGTPAYMSPEQTRGEPLDARSDLFSLGTTLYEAATGRRPFEGPSALAILHAIATSEPLPLSRCRPDLPPGLDSVVARALAKDPDDRWASGRDLADALRGLRDGAGVTSASITLPRGIEPAAARHNIPASLTSFIGRRRERAEVRRLFAAGRLVTVLGAGGTGKTRLALQVAADMLADEPDGVWVVELATLADPALVTPTAAHVLDVRETPGRALEHTLAETIGSKTMLLVLDNCEHLAAACARLADALLRACPHLRILATSQEGLGVSGEIVWRIPTLSVPDVRPSLPPTKESAARFEAVRLFVERAVAAQPSFALTDANAPAVAQICHRLDGIPFAIELAAVRVKVLSVDKILARLEDRFQLLTGGSRTALARQQTLRAAVDWSYELLSPMERTLLDRLGIFTGGCTLEAAEEVCSWDALEPDEVLDLLAHLADKSLVGPTQGSDGGMRYGLLETIRAYAQERADRAGATETLKTRHAVYFLKLAESAEPELQGPEQGRWLNRLEDEHDNLRQAIETATLSRDPDVALRLCGALWRFWWIRGNWSEGRDRIQSALRLESVEPRTLPRAKALRAGAVLARGQGDYDAATALLTESLEIAREQSDPAATAATLLEMANVANDQDRLEDARRLYEECLRIRRAIDDRRGIGLALHNLAVTAEALQRPQEATALYEEALALHREVGNRAAEASGLNGLGVVAHAQGDLERARASQELALAIQRELRDMRGIAFSLRELGVIASRRREVAMATRHLAECMEIYQALGDRQGLATAMEACAGVAAAAGQPERALSLAGAAAALREELDSPLSPSDQELLSASLEGARARLGPAAANLFEEGKTLEISDAIRLAVETGSEAAGVAPERGGGPPTAR
jgi:predicted ATPase/tRNA A-37 threonylcarbamoyl transferase component Bud32